MDMSPLFRSIAKTLFPKARVVADKFHVCRLVNLALEAVIKYEQKKFTKTRRIYFKKSRHVLLKSSKALSADEQIILNNLLSVSPLLEKSYYLKKMFFEIVHEDDRKARLNKLQHWIDSVNMANIPKFNQLLQSITKWWLEIGYALDTGYSNGYTEGCNNKIKVLKRVS